MKKNVFKIILDAVMLVLLLLMYDVRAISAEFHEIGGIVLFGLFVAHIALNFKWIAHSARNLFSAALPGKTRLKFLTDVLLFICIALITLSGILISEVVFRPAQGGGGWRIVHCFASGAALIILGVHIGLNWALIKNMIKLPRAAAISLAAVLLAAILGYGGYSLVTSNFAAWLASPFTSVAFSDGHEFGGNNFILPEGAQGQFIEPGNGQLPGRLPEGREQYDGNGQRFGQGPGQGGGQGFGKGNGQGLVRRGGFAASGGALGTLATYGSITGVFAVITAVLGKLIKRPKKQDTVVNGEPAGGGTV